MNPVSIRTAATLLVLQCAAAFAAPATTPTTASADSWRFTQARPLAEGIPALGDPAQLRGKQVRFTGSGLEGPRPFACKKGRVEILSVPADGLFEGTLAAPAANSAAALGLAPGPYRLRRLGCVSGGGDLGFDFVEADADAETLLVALDGRIWTLSRAPGALAAAGTPEATVERLLEAHYAGSSAFLPETLAAKNGWLSAALKAAARTYFAKSRPDDEVPPIDGDPFSNSQDELTWFAVGAARLDGTRATVPVRIAQPVAAPRLDYLLLREADGWKLDDILIGGDPASSLRHTLEHE